MLRRARQTAQSDRDRALADATLSPDGALVVAGDADGLRRFWDAATARPLWTHARRRWGCDLVVSVGFQELPRSSQPARGAPGRLIVALHHPHDHGAVLFAGGQRLLHQVPMAQPDSGKEQTGQILRTVRLTTPTAKLTGAMGYGSNRTASSRAPAVTAAASGSASSSSTSHSGIASCSTFSIADSITLRTSSSGSSTLVKSMLDL